MAKRTADIDWLGIAPVVAVALYGEPVKKTATEWRWEEPSSLYFSPMAGTWYRFSQGIGGGVLDMVEHARQCDRESAWQWIKDKHYVGSVKTVERMREEMPYGQRGKQANAPNYWRMKPDAIKLGQGWTPFQVIRSSARSHPFWRWADKRKLWSGPAVSPVLWIPASDMWFRNKHTGAGAILCPVVPMPKCGDGPARAVGCQLIHIDSNGNPALDRALEDGGLSKRSYGLLRGSVFPVGLVGGPKRSRHIAVCEGVADALAIASHAEVPVVAAMSANNYKNLLVPLLTYDKVTIYADNDEAGIESAVKLAKELNKRKPGMVQGLVCDKDPADHFSSTPFRIRNYNARG